MEFLTEYGVFLAKAVTIVIAILIVIAAGAGAASKGKRGAHKKEMKVEHLNERLRENKEEIESHILDKETLKTQKKAEKKAQKQSKKSSSGAEGDDKKRVYVIDFDGDIKASAVDTFRESVTTVLQVARPDKDEVVVRLESPGGMVHSYGLAAAQLDRIRNSKLKLTACVDKVAASGGYMMACVADRIVASPFAIMGSIGVVAQLPNFHRLLKKNEIDFEVLTAGEHKRTLTVFGENTEKGREKFQSDLEDTHELFKSYVAERRPVVDIDKVANGDIWFGSRALQVNLVDELCTSDDYLLKACDGAEVYEVNFQEKQSLADKLSLGVSHAVDKTLLKWFQELDVTKSFR